MYAIIKTGGKQYKVEPGTVLSIEKLNAEIGDEVQVETATNRTETGTLVEVNPYYTHSYGKFVPELVQIDRQLREILFGGEE